MVRRGSHPRLSVILIVEGSPSYAMRALESVQNQDLYDLQIVVVCRGVVAGVRHSLEVAAGRDIHIDLIDAEDPAPGACLRAGFAASRGSQIIAMNANEWFAPQSLLRMVDSSCDASADIVFPSVSLDRYDAHRERHSRVLDAASVSGDGDQAACLTQLVSCGLIRQSSGVLYDRTLFEACLAHGDAFRTVAPSITETFDPTMFARLSDDIGALDRLADSLAVGGGSDQLNLVCQRYYYTGLVACIENLCLSPHGVSSIERSARLHDMLDAQRTRQMVVALKGNHRGLGLLYGSIASAKPMRCALYTHLAAFFNRSGARTV